MPFALDSLSDDQRWEFAVRLMPAVNAAVRAYAELPESVKAAVEAHAAMKRGSE